jgi:hydroxyethylthiazole kinase-like uncharacterized protein yjeF
MSIVLTSAQMKQLDRRTIHDFGIPSRVLMETAGKGCVDYLKDTFDGDLALGTVVLCGHGNNGGDGYVIARWLEFYGYAVNIISIGEGEMSPEAKTNKELCEKLGINFVIPSKSDYEIFSNIGVVIDAIYGIGFKGKLDKSVEEIITRVNGLQALKVAIDIPSGVDADTGFAEIAFQADITLTMDSYKLGHFLGKGRQHTGIVDIIPIGIPYLLKNNLKTAVLVDEDNALLPERKEYANKGDYGRIAVFAGSPGFTGAAFLSSLAAVKAGAGLVTIYSHPSCLSIYDSKPSEVMVQEVPLNKDGSVDFDALDKKLEKTDVILIGPGCGVSDYTLNLMTYLTDRWQKPAVIDADGLNTIARNPELLAKLSGKPFILTPHWSEFCRLAKVTAEDLHKDSLSCLKDFADKHKLNILLKSHTSAFYDGDNLLINTTGNDGLATGGSGDVLAGLIAGFLGQRMPLPKAAINASYFLGLTAEVLADKQETLSITPTDILNNIFRFDLLEVEEDEES